MEAILFDLEPSAQIQQVFSGALGLMGGLKAESRAEFVKRVALAIEDIKSRAASAAETAYPSDTVPCGRWIVGSRLVSVPWVPTPPVVLGLPSSLSGAIPELLS